MPDRPPTDGEQWSLAALVERYHQEDNQWKGRHMDAHREIDRHLGALAFADQRTEDRLNSGIKSFSAVESQIEKLNAKITWPAWKVVTIALGLVTVLAGGIFMIARMPTRAEFEGIQNRVEGLMVEQARANQKLDLLIESRNPGR